ncbi:MAG: hypothetical protein WBM24_06230 [Candidatus Sulfotelmatobacter sp.]
MRVPSFVVRLLLYMAVACGGCGVAATQASRSFSGEWNERKAEEIAFQIARSWPTSAQQNSQAASEKPRQNQVYAFLPFDKVGVQRWLVLVSQSPPDNNCHACSPVTGGIIFTRKGDTFEADYDQPEIVSMGGWGQPPLARLQALGPGKPAVVFEVDGMGQGYAGKTLTFVAEVEGRLKSVLSLQVAGSNEAADLPEEQTFRWDSVLEFDPHGDRGYADIRVKSSGTKEVEESGTQRVEPYSSTAVYRFEDGVYKPLK